MRRLLTLLPALLLAGCGGLPELPPPSPQAQAAWEQHNLRLAELDHWQMQGRFSLTAGDENWTGTMTWNQSPGDVRIQLSSPMGQGLIALTETAEGAVLEMADDRTYRGESGEALFRDTVGWDLPLDTLGQWLLGRPDPDRDFRTRLSERGLVTSLYQGPWQAEYPAYHQDLQPPLPRKLQLTRRGVKLKLVVDRWSIRDNAGSTTTPTGSEHESKTVAGTGQT